MVYFLKIILIGLFFSNFAAFRDSTNGNRRSKIGSRAWKFTFYAINAPEFCLSSGEKDYSPALPPKQKQFLKWRMTRRQRLVEDFRRYLDIYGEGIAKVPCSES